MAGARFLATNFVFHSSTYVCNRIPAWCDLNDYELIAVYEDAGMFENAWRQPLIAQVRMVSVTACREDISDINAH